MRRFASCRGVSDAARMFAIVWEQEAQLSQWDANAGGDVSIDRPVNAILHSWVEHNVMHIHLF